MIILQQEFVQERALALTAKQFKFDVPRRALIKRLGHSSSEPKSIKKPDRPYRLVIDFISKFKYPKGISHQRSPKSMKEPPF